MGKGFFMSLMLALCAVAGWAERIYNESGGLVIMEMENTESALSGWDFRAKDASGYPVGATGAGHLEYMRFGLEGWGKPSSPLVYKFKINKAGIYRLFFRAHKRLNPGNAGDKHNDCFIRMEGDFESGSAEAALSALLADSKVYGGDADAWGRATNMDAHGADHKPVYYKFKAGEIYTFTVSGRSNQFNLDRIMFAHSDVGKWPNDSVFAGRPESELFSDR